MSTASKLNRILTTKSDLKTALVTKGQNVTDETPFKNYASYIANLDNTSDANATARDIASGKTAYVNGVKVTGNVSTVSAGAALERYTSDVTYFSETLCFCIRFLRLHTGQTYCLGLILLYNCGFHKRRSHNV